ncbi:MAG TPA: hypothetical protein VIJ79_09775 [Acidobacteriaceae bacterium]
MTLLSSTQRIIRISLAGGLALGLATLAGCGVGTLAGPSPSGPMPLANISGTVHGGQQPISLATIQLWAVGSSGYGSDGTNLLGSHVVTTDPGGNFSITGDYTCPTDDTLVYITATAGDPGIGGGNNTAIKLVAALGPCGPLAANTNTFISINEVTTAATAVALGQYFSTTFGSGGSDNFGTANTAQAKVGLANAFATVNNLVDTTQGIALTTVSITGAAGTITATPEAAKLNTIADILAACVNSDGGASSPCQTTLFPDVTPAGKAQPTDTLQAAVYMALNPTSNNANGSAANLAALYVLQTPQSPFVGGTQPTDWTVGILYTSPVLLAPLSVAADASGNIWVLNGTAATNGSLVELNPTGSALVNALTAANGGTSGTGINTSTPRNIAIDLNGNPWISTTTSGGWVFQYVASSGTVNSFAAGKSPYGVAIDGNNNVFVGSASTSAHFEMFEYPGADITKEIRYPIASSTPGTAGTDLQNLFILPEYMAFDTFGNLWMSNGSATSATSSNAVVQLSNIDPSACIGASIVYPCTVSTSTTANTFTQINQGTPAAPFGLAANTNSLWFANSTSGSNTVTDLSLTGSTVNSGTAYGSGTSITSPRLLAVDGSGNVWVADKNATPGSVSELSNTGSILSPVNSGAAPFNTIGFSHAGLNSGTGITVDPSGNVWVANNLASGTDGNSVFEIVGAASPTVTPIALALKNSTVAAKP